MTLALWLDSVFVYLFHRLNSLNTNIPDMSEEQKSAKGNVQYTPKIGRIPIVLNNMGRNSSDGIKKRICRDRLKIEA